jgi:Pyruvate/2-oxoacid:ferredoxin oxidoreductase delta subunit
MTILWIFLGLLLIFLFFFFILGERLHIKDSTKKWFRTSGVKRFFNMNTFHGYIYMRWQKEYLSFFINKIRPISTKFLRNWWADQYHNKVLTEEQAERLIVIEEDIPRQNLDQIVPYPKAREIILNAPPKITVFECGCRNAREVHCEPTQVCMFIGDPFADFMAEHHPNESRRISQEEALELLRQEHARGHVHSAWFKNAMADRFYCICNCCKCCCGGIELMNQFGTKMANSSGYVATLDDENCINCGICADWCPFEAISTNGKTLIRWEKCMGCGVCIDQCPNHALALVLDAAKGVPLDVRLLET